MEAVLDSAETLDFRILMCLLGERTREVTMAELSRILHEQRYTITRAADRLEKRGLVKRSEDRIPALTEEGLSAAERYFERFRIAQNHLLYEGVDPEHANQDACCLALHGSDEMMEVLRSSDERSRVKRELRDEESFSGGTLCRMLKNGTYFFPFIIYREKARGGNNLSMANRGFENPCALYVENGEGVVQLRIRAVEQSSGLDGSMLRGKVSRLEYEDSGRFIPAEFHGDVISFPAEVLHFINLGDSSGRILHGSVGIKMQCSCGIAHMPESRALFTVLI